MNSKALSILQQKAKGTYRRNEQIRLLAKDGENFASLGRMFKLSRQAVRAIVNQSNAKGGNEE